MAIGLGPADKLELDSKGCNMRASGLRRAGHLKLLCSFLEERRTREGEWVLKRPVNE